MILMQSRGKITVFSNGTMRPFLGVFFGWPCRMQPIWLIPISLCKLPRWPKRNKIKRKEKVIFLALPLWEWSVGWPQAFLGNNLAKAPWNHKNQLPSNNEMHVSAPKEFIKPMELGNLPRISDCFHKTNPYQFRSVTVPAAPHDTWAFKICGWKSVGSKGLERSCSNSDSHPVGDDPGLVRTWIRDLIKGQTR